MRDECPGLAQCAEERVSDAKQVAKPANVSIGCLLPLPFSSSGYASDFILKAISNPTCPKEAMQQ